MSAQFRVVGCVTLLLVAAGCSSEDEAQETSSGNENWTSFGRDGANSRAALGEKTLSASNAAQLKALWSDRDARDEGQGVTSTPAVVDDVVYWGTWGGWYKAFTTSGEPIWERQHIHPETSFPISTTTSPLVVGDTVYFTVGPASLLALERATGEILWITESFDPDGWQLSSAALAEDVIVFGVASAAVYNPAEPRFRGSVIGVDRHSGTKVWSLDATLHNDTQYGVGISIWSSAAIDTKRKHAYIGTGQSWRSPASPLSDALIAIDYRTGDLVWYSQFTPNDAWHITVPGGLDHDVGSTPNLFTAGGQDLVGVGDKSGSYYALARDCSGECAPVWQAKLGTGGRLGGVMSASAYHDGVIYVSHNAWSAGFGGLRNPENKSHVYALDASDGSPTIWDQPYAVVDGPTFGGLTWANGLLFVPTTAGTIHALDTANQGTELWSHKVDDMVGGGISVSRGKVFVGQGFLNLVAFGGGEPPPIPDFHAFGLP